MLDADAAQIPLAVTARQEGGHVRVGREDIIVILGGVLAGSNALQVAEQACAWQEPDEGGG